MWSTARKALKGCDPRVDALLRSAGPCTLRPRRDHFETLCHSIVSQQLSTKAAATIWRRLREVLLAQGSGLRRVEPGLLRHFGDTQVRSCGISSQKLGYLRDLDARASSGALALKFSSSMDDEAVILNLTEVKGIGVWTAQMFLIFSLNRPDVFPVGDLGIREAMKRVWKLKTRDDHPKLERLASAWQPHRTLVTWALWRSLDNKP